MSIKVQILDFDMNQFAQLVELFGSYFQPNDRLLTADYTEWLYGMNPFGLAKVAVAADNDSWIGFMALIPVRLSRRNTHLIGYYVVNVLVHPVHQGRQVFGHMISAAKKFVMAEDAVLMGHPNTAALKSWQRGGMHFHDALRPALVRPGVRSRRVRTYWVESSKQLHGVLTVLSTRASGPDKWCLDLSVEYVDWRFFRHPTNTYRVQLVESEGSPVGFNVTKRLRPGIHLLIDQFAIDACVADVMKSLPLLTVLFRSTMSMQRDSRSLWQLPAKKAIPFFCTYYKEPFATAEVMNLGLSASDF